MFVTSGVHYKRTPTTGNKMYYWKKENYEIAASEVTINKNGALIPTRMVSITFYGNPAFDCRQKHTTFNTKEEAFLHVDKLLAKHPSR